MKKIYTLIIVAIFTGGVFSCTEIEPLNIEETAVKELYSKRDSVKWIEEDAARKKNIEDSIALTTENARLYELYLKDLRAYKESEHPIMFGWFNAWEPASPSAYSQLTLLPDSMDIVSIWGTDKMFNLNEEKKEQLKEVQAKGTKVIIGWILENVGDQIVWDKTFWPDEPEDAIRAYAQAICDSIHKYGYDGFDIDYEPSYASPFKPGMHCGDWTTPWEENKALISCNRDYNKEYENLFFRTMRELLGPDKILNINGSIDWLDPESAHLFNYFVVQSYNGTHASWTNKVLNRLQYAGVKKNQIIYTESFENKEQNRLNFKRYADFVVNTLDRHAGGIGAYHINEDALDNNNYQHIRKAISIMNPPIK